MRVTIHPEPEDNFDVGLEGVLEHHFHLDEAVVIDTGDSPAADSLGLVASQVALRSLSNDMGIGISWGRSVATMVEQTAPTTEFTGLTVVSLSGGVGPVRQDIISNTLVLRLAAKLHAQPYTLDAPAIVQTHAAHQALLHDPAIAPVIALGTRVNVALVGIGAVGEFSTLSTMKYLDQRLLDELMGLGAVGDICSRFYNLEGQTVVSEIDRRTIGLDLPGLKRVPRVIGLGWGSEKIRAIAGALKSGILNVLVTDQSTAKGLLDYL